MPTEKETDASEAPEETAPAEEHGWRELITKEDYWSIWLGFILIAVALAAFLPRRPDGMDEKMAKLNNTMAAESRAAPFKTIAWHQANDSKKKIKATGERWYKKGLKKWISKPHGWKTNPAKSLYLDEEGAEAKKAAAMPKYEAAAGEAERMLAEARKTETEARAAGLKNATLNARAVAAIGQWRNARQTASKAKRKTKVEAYNQAGYLVGLCVALALLFGVGIRFMGESIGRFVAGFTFVFAIAVLSYMMHYQATMKAYGLGYAAWAIVFGLLISNTIGTPKWVMPAVKTEYYIKTGLVLLGAEVLLGKIAAIGAPGLFVAWVVTPLVLISSYIFGLRMLKGISKTLNITISAAVSVCGVSAAIATAAACKAKKEELTLAVGMSLVFTSIMMFVMPNIINAIGMGHVLAGAWMGGTIDATGAVAAAGEFLSDRALYVAATVKMIQNILIGIVAFCVAVYWCARVERAKGTHVSAMEIWYRFPKFVIGFVAASIAVTLIYQSLGADAAHAMIDNGVIRGLTKVFRGWFFCLAFVSIGLAMNFRELRKNFAGGQPLILYVAGQSLNLIVTLLMAYLMFNLVFPDVAAQLS